MPGINEREAFPLRVTEVTFASQDEWRTGQQLPEHLNTDWQLVYVVSGAVEERTNDRKDLLREGMICFHQPNEHHAMRALGEVPPVVLRVEFECAGAAMDALRNRIVRASISEKSCLGQIGECAGELFEQPDGIEKPPVLRADPPFAAQQLAALTVEYLLIMVYRRLHRARKPSPRAAAEKRQKELVEAVRLYFSKNLTKELHSEDICEANHCGRVQLQQAFRARTRMAPMEYFARMRLEQAGMLLTLGHTPGEVARMMGYASGAYFSHRFTAIVGITPSAYRRKPYPLQLCNN